MRRRPVGDCEVPDDEVRVRIPNVSPRAGGCEDRQTCDDEGARGRAGPADHAARGREIPVAVDENRALIQAHRNGTGGTRSDRQDRHREEKRGYGERPSSWPKAEHGPSQETIFARLYRPSLRGTAGRPRTLPDPRRPGRGPNDEPLAQREADRAPDHVHKEGQQKDEKPVVDDIVHEDVGLCADAGEYRRDGEYGRDGDAKGDREEDLDDAIL